MPLGVASSNPPNFSTAPMNDRCNSGVQRRRAFSELAPADVFELPERFPPLPSLTGADVVARSLRPADADVDADARFLRPRPPVRPERSAPPPSSPSTAKLPISNPPKSTPPSSLPTAANPSSRRSNTSSNQSYKTYDARPNPSVSRQSRREPKAHPSIVAHLRACLYPPTPRRARKETHNTNTLHVTHHATPTHARRHHPYTRMHPQNILTRIASPSHAPAHRARRARRRR